MSIQKHASGDIHTATVANAFRGTWLYDVVSEYNGYAMPFVWPSMPSAARLEIVASLQDKSATRVLRRVLLSCAKKAQARHKAGLSRVAPFNGVRAASFLKEQTSLSDRGGPVTIPMFMDDDGSSETRVAKAIFDLVLWANAVKNQGYGKEAVRLLTALVELDPGMNMDLDEVLTREASWIDVGNAVTKFALSSVPGAEMTSFSSGLAEHLPADVVDVITSVAGGVEEGWVSLTDEQVAQVVLSRPVVESDPSRALECVLEALQAGAVAFDVRNTSVAQSTVVSLLTTPSVHTILSEGPGFIDPIAAILAKADAVSPALVDLGLLANAMRDVVVAQMPTARLGMHDTLMSMFDSMESEYKDMAKSRFLRTLRACYTGEDVFSAFLPHNVALNTSGVDIEKAQKFLAKKNLGGLASAFMAKRDLDEAWVSMPVLSYLELLRWDEFAQFASSFPTGPVHKLRPMIIRLVLRMHQKLLDSVVVEGVGSASSTLVEHLLHTPVDQQFHMSDYRSSDADVRDFIHSLVLLANATREEQDVDDDSLLMFGNLLKNQRFLGQSNLAAVRRLCDALLPKALCLDFLKKQIAAAL